jgi:hypothetical protein
MGLGLQGAYGLQGGYDALNELIAARKKDELLAAKNQDDELKRQLELAKFAEDKRQFDLTNQRLADAEGVTRARLDKQDTINEANRIQTTSAIGDTIIPDKVVSLIKAGDSNVLQPTPIMPTIRGMISRIGGTAAPDPNSPQVGGDLVYGGNAQQQHQAASDALSEKRYAEQQARDAANERYRQFQENATNRRIEAMANKPDPLTQVNTVDEAGNPVVKIVPKVSGASYPAAPTSAERTQAHTLPEVKSVIQDLDTLSSGINTKEGLGQWVTGAKRQAAAAVNQDDNAANYLSVKRAWTLTLARLQAQQRISNQEMVNATQLAPEMTDPKNVRDNKIARLWKFYNEKVASLPPGGRATAGGSGTSDAAPAPDTTDPYGVLNLFPPK